MGCYSPESFITRDHSGYGLSQWETTLHCNVASYWLCPYSEWSLMTRFSVSIHISEMASQINCLLNSLLGPAIKKTSTTGVAGSCDGNLRVTGGFPEKNRKLFPCYDIRYTLYITVTSKWARWCLKSPASLLFTHIRLFRPRSKKTSKLRVTVLCEGNSPVIGEFPTQRASDMEMFPFDDVIMTSVR